VKRITIIPVGKVRTIPVLAITQPDRQMATAIDVTIELDDEILGNARAGATRDIVFERGSSANN